MFLFANGKAIPKAFYIKPTDSFLMEIIYILLLIIFISLSPLIGFLLARSTKEEQAKARPYLVVAFLVVFVILSATILALNIGSFYVFLLSLLLGIILSFFIKSYLFYTGLIFFANLIFEQNALFLIASLVFLLNLILGTFLYSTDKKINYFIKKELLLFVIPIISYLIYLGFSPSLNLLSGAGISAILSLMLNQKSNKLRHFNKNKR